jgi:hypothetical protein
MRRRSGPKRDVREWWQQWTVDKPAAFGDWLWKVLVVQVAALLDRLSLRRALEIFAITLLALVFIQTFPIDLAFLFAGDTLMYLEIVTLSSLLAASIRVRALLQYLAQSLKNTWNATFNMICRMALRVRISRQRRTRRRVAIACVKKDSNEDCPVIGWASAAAAA